MDEDIIRNQIAIFNLLGALFKEVTGENPIVSIVSGDGNVYKIEPSRYAVTTSSSGGGGRVPVGQFLSEKPKQTRRGRGHCADLLRPPQSARH